MEQKNYAEKIKMYEEDMLDFELSPFETVNALHLRTELQEQFLDMNTEEQIELLSVDLKVIKNARGISEHLARIYTSERSHRPIEEWWWHLDKIAKGEISLIGFNILYK